MTEQSITINLDPIVGPTVKKLATEFGKVMDRFDVYLRNAFVDYLIRTRERVSKIKTLICRQEPINLLDCYVAPTFALGANNISEEQMASEILKNKRIAVTATAGAGKSLYTKFVFLTSSQKFPDKIPIFIELRHLNNREDSSVLKFAYEQLRGANKRFTQDQFQFALDSECFVLILDGFDEVRQDKRTAIQEELFKFAHENPKTAIIVSSRPDEVFHAWQEFYEYRILPMSLEKTEALVEKIPFDLNTKKSFISKLKSGLYESHKSFLSNPLLTTMMLMSYDEYAEIPEKMHVFYEEAFSVLAKKHDATKSLFSRQYHSELSTPELRNIFAAFCFFSHAEHGASLEKAVATQQIDNARQYFGNMADSSAILHDFEKSICILLKEGSTYSFIHRSFQEYFAGVFLTKLPPQLGEKAINRLTANTRTLSVVRLALDIDQDYVERNYIFPGLRKLIPLLDGIDAKANPSAVAKLFYRSIEDTNGKHPDFAKKYKYVFYSEQDKDIFKNFILMHTCRRHYRKMGAGGDIGYFVTTGSIGKLPADSYINRRPILRAEIRAMYNDLIGIFAEVEERISQRTDLIGEILKQTNKPARRVSS